MKVLEESFRTLLEQRSKGGGVKYKILDIDDSEIGLCKVNKKIISLKRLKVNA
jgi:hypothetical protein